MWFLEEKKQNKTKQSLLILGEANKERQICCKVWG